jgi:hypothetical protein
MCPNSHTVLDYTAYPECDHILVQCGSSVVKVVSVIRRTLNYQF